MRGKRPLFVPSLPPCSFVVRACVGWGPCPMGPMGCLHGAIRGRRGDSASWLTKGPTALQQARRRVGTTTTPRASRSGERPHNIMLFHWADHRPCPPSLNPKDHPWLLTRRPSSAFVPSLSRPRHHTRHSFATYRESTMPIIEHFRGQGKLWEVAAARPKGAYACICRRRGKRVS